MEPKVISRHSQNSNFLHHFEPFWLQKWFERVWNSKNHHLLTFLCIKTVSRIVRSCCLFLQVPMVVKKCLQTYYIIVIALTYFCGAQTHQRSIQKHYFLHKFEQTFALNAQNYAKSSVFGLISDDFVRRKNMLGQR